MPRQYTHIGVNRYWTLYFIPIIPLGQRGTYVECQQCTGTFGPEVLNYQPDPGLKRLLDETSIKMWHDLRRCLVVLCYHAQRTGPDAFQRLKSLYETRSKQTLSPEVASQEFQQAAEANVQLEPFARHLFGTLPDNERAFVLQAGRELLASEGRLTDRDRDLLRQLGRGLALPGQLVESTLAS
jgi:hypothetical protein